MLIFKENKKACYKYFGLNYAYRTLILRKMFFLNKEKKNNNFENFLFLLVSKINYYI